MQYFALRHLSTNNLQVEISLEIVFKCALFVLLWGTGKVFCTDKICCWEILIELTVSIGVGVNIIPL